ncbi:EAP30/Vps36 family-domain-containing protein [Hyaloraphidium curvatum]|nr:EAP30/Vps36 family-domain-containing protein [Hyaloraphidium curvatum]
MHFQKMCNQIGVDPLASTKGFWSDLLGIGDFYFELGIQVAECCLRTRDRNGGLIDLEELKRLVEKSRGRAAQEITEDDIVRAIKSLQPLGSGFEILTLGSRRVVSSVPRELNVDHSAVLNAAQAAGGFVTMDAMLARGWARERAEAALEGMVREGICWVDLQAAPTEWWIPGFFGGDE